MAGARALVFRVWKTVEFRAMDGPRIVQVSSLRLFAHETAPTPLPAPGPGSPRMRYEAERSET